MLLILLGVYLLYTRLTGAAEVDSTGNPPKEVQHDQQ
jgi:hypothetical protein